MADIEQAIISRVLADATIYSLVNKRIRPIAAAQWDVYPYIGFYTQIPDEQFDHFKGRAETRKVEFNFDIWGRTMAQVKAVSLALRESLDYLNAETIEDIEIRLMKHNNDNDLSEPPNVGEPNPIKRVSSSYTVLFRGI